MSVNHREDEAWYVLNGQMTFYVGDLALEARSGSFVSAPFEEVLLVGVLGVAFIDAAVWRFGRQD